MGNSLNRTPINRSLLVNLKLLTTWMRRTSIMNTIGAVGDMLKHAEFAITEAEQTPTTTKDYKTLVNDLQVVEEEAGGFYFVYIHDSDDGDTFQLGEDEMIALHEYLGEYLKHNELM